jgi:integrase/recombinase XerC
VSASSALPTLLQAFFYDWAIQQRSLSPHTVRSYRDTWRLFLRFAAKRHHRSVSQLSLQQLNDTTVLAFLDHSELEHHGSIGSRNCRLAALRSFYSFAATRDPSNIALCAAVLQVPTKRAPRPALCYLDTNEIEAILAQPDQRTLEGLRDHALLLLLYNTGARIQEALDLCPNAIRFSAPSTVRLFGKCHKERICPLWPETVQILRRLLNRQHRDDDQRLFVNRYGQPLGASGVRFKLAEYVKEATKSTPSLSNKNVTPHTLRRSAAVALIAAGVDIAVIRSWLGHASIDTTAHYAQANLETKRSALERLNSPIQRGAHAPRWRRNSDILTWLDSL